MSIDSARSLKDPKEREHRRALLNSAHMIPLKDYAERLRQCNRYEVPDFDSMDGGIEAEILFIFEKPGPMTANLGGSGLISRNNDDPTAENTFKIMSTANIPRQMTCIWNLVPGWNGTIKVTSQEKAMGRECLEELIALMPKIKVIILVGGTAKSAKKKIEKLSIVNERHIKVMTSYHPAKRVENRYPQKFATLKDDWKDAMRIATPEAAQ